jgi:DNA polymerase-3 subunit chi
LLRVDFAFDAHDRVTQAVSTTLRQVGRGTPILVLCDDEARQQRYTRELWTQQADTQFVVHEPLAADTTNTTIGATGANNATDRLMVYLLNTESWPLLANKLSEPFYSQSWLLNLNDNPPPDLAVFERILEIVSQDPEEREQARQRWRFYQERGADLHAHRLPA